MPIRQSTTQEGPVQVSKWLDCQLLIDTDEMRSLFAELGPFYLYSCGVIVTGDKGEVPLQAFLRTYSKYIDELKQGRIPDTTTCRPAFALTMTTDLDHLFAVPIGEDRRIIRPAKPVIQMQANYVHYSSIDKKFHTMVFGSDSIAWGIQFSYPQLYQDSVTKQVDSVKDTSAFPNTSLFHKIQKWMRQHTIPTPVEVDGVRINIPIRLGKQCLTWINSHPDLNRKGIFVRC